MLEKKKLSLFVCIHLMTNRIMSPRNNIGRTLPHESDGVIRRVAGSRTRGGLQKEFGTKLRFSTAFHPQTGGLSKLLRTCYELVCWTWELTGRNICP